MDRDEFERRLLALVRNYMDDADALYPEGYDIGDFMVLYEVFTRVPDTEQLDPWSGGPRAGWNSPNISFSSTTTAFWLDEAWLAETLAHVRSIRRSLGDDEAGRPDETEE